MSDPQPTQPGTPPEQTPSGEIKDQSPILGTETKETKPEPKAEGSLLNAKEPAKPLGAPEKYEPFKLPEGYELSETAAADVSKMFKDMGLSQPQAQQLVDFYSKNLIEAAEGPVKFYQEMREGWRNDIRSDPEIGHKLNDVRTTVSKALDSLGDAKLATEFREAMDLTGAGDHPAFIRAFYKLAQRVTEGSHVSGNGPAPVAAPGSRPPPAKALFPNLA